MRRGSRSSKLRITNYNSQIPQRGYMMITLMLALALITIALLTALPNIKQQSQRDREEELRHRGTSYMRAIQHFYKKVGRYPSRVEELENTSNIRYLRKRYKDPVNRDAAGKERDFKFLHVQDINLNNGPVLGTTAGQSPFGQGGTNGPQAQGGFGGGLQGGPGNSGAQPGASQQAGNGTTPASGSSDSGNSSSGNSSSDNSKDNANSGLGADG